MARAAGPPVHPPVLGHRDGGLAIVNAKIYISPDTAPIDQGTVLVRGDQITEVGTSIKVPPGTLLLDGEGKVVTAGFWNTHIHLTESKWASPSVRAPESLNSQFAEMLTSRGFTTVVDAGSDPRVTFPLRNRIAAGELVGPAIYTAGPSVFPPKGIPFYLNDSLPRHLRRFVPQPSSPSAAVRAVERNIAQGADLLKLFTGSYVAPGQVVPMPEPIAKAAVESAHAHGQLVYSHSSNLAGTLVAVRSGVDVLAHAPDTTEGIDDAFLKTVVDRQMVMIPTLKMFATTVTSNRSYLQPIYDLVRRFRELGGSLMFGTDVGYMTDYSTQGEITGLGLSGLTALDVLRTLTAAPADRFGVANKKGSVRGGMDADLVVLDGDPSTDLSMYSQVRWTIRRGQVIWAHP